MNEQIKAQETTHATPITSLEKTDWAHVWRELQVQREAADDASYWDERSKTFGMNDKPNDYALSFLQLADLQPGERVFDMGCGNGALALPCAAAGHPVLAADFSHGMLDRLENDAAEQGLTNIEAKQVSWEGDWEAAGILPKSCDVAFASRSIATSDLKNSLLRLNSIARRKCCITLATSYSPRCDDRIMRVIGFDSLVGRDFWYATNILMQLGALPEVRYIESTRYDTYESSQAAWENLQLMLEAALKANPDHDEAEAQARLKAWFDTNLVENAPIEDVGGKESQTTYTFKEPRTVTWAFISWNAEKLDTYNAI